MSRDRPASKWYPLPCLYAVRALLQGARQLNGVCEHVCCARRPYCLVSKLGQYRTLYQEGQGVDQFKLKVGVPYLQYCTVLQMHAHCGARNALGAPSQTSLAPHPTEDLGAAMQ